MTTTIGPCAGRGPRGPRGGVGAGAVALATAGGLKGVATATGSGVCDAGRTGPYLWRPGLLRPGLAGSAGLGEPAVAMEAWSPGRRGVRGGTV